jgi:3-hydroxyacyl-CoA dehydrogenase
MSEQVEAEMRSGIAVIALNNPPVNAMNAEVRRALDAATTRAATDPAVKAIVLTGKGRCFSGGADIKEFGKPRVRPLLTDLCTSLEMAAKPVIAAIHGVAVGGGTELSLGCHYRVGHFSAMIGLPEVKLGQIPGAGGSQRLPRLIGFGPALDMILTGEQVAAVRAKELGFLDEVVDGDIVEEATAYAQRLIAEGRGPRPTRDIPVDAERAAKAIAEARSKVAKTARGLIAPMKCIDAVERILNMPIDQALIEDRVSFDELAVSDQGRAQRHLFFAQRLAEKPSFVPQGTKPIELRRIGVVGCGTMGQGIAAAVARAGFDVTVLETDAGRLKSGISAIGRILDDKRGATAASKPGAVTGSQSPEALADADMVIEAAFEDLLLKKEIFAALARICGARTLLATNTSSLDINEIASGVANPERVLGAHFFSPAHVTKLLEIVRADRSSPEAIATLLSFARRIKKAGVVVGVCNGFVGNRMLYAYRSQAEFMLEEGALPHQVDAAVQNFGFPMGPFAVGDLAGLDVGYRVRQQQRHLAPQGERYSSTVADRIVEMGRLGQKNGMGWYRYDEGSRKPIPDPVVEALIAEVSKAHGTERRPIGEQEIYERCIFALINEGAKILGEGIAQRPSDIDVIWTQGYGFPIGKGGPMFYADQVGLPVVLDRLARLQERHGEELRPAPFLEDLVRRGQTLGDLNTRQ